MRRVFASKQAIAVYVLFVAACCFFFYTNYGVAKQNRESRTYCYPTMARARIEYEAAPNDRVALRSMATQSMLANDPAGELVYLRKLYVVDPGDRSRSYWLATILFHNGDPKDVAQSLTIMRSLSTGHDWFGKTSKQVLLSLELQEHR